MSLFDTLRIFPSTVDLSKASIAWLTYEAFSKKTTAYPLSVPLGIFGISISVILPIEERSEWASSFEKLSGKLKMTTRLAILLEKLSLLLYSGVGIAF